MKESLLVCWKCAKLCRADPLSELEMAFLRRHKSCRHKTVTCYLSGDVFVGPGVSREELRHLGYLKKSGYESEFSSLELVALSLEEEKS